MVRGGPLATGCRAARNQGERGTGKRGSGVEWLKRAQTTTEGRCWKLISGESSLEDGYSIGGGPPANGCRMATNQRERGTGKKEEKLGGLAGGDACERVGGPAEGGLEIGESLG